MDGIFIWNNASWDIQGIYPESATDGAGSYRDPVVVAMIEAHNSAVASGSRPPNVDAGAPGGGVAPYADGGGGRAQVATASAGRR